MAVGAEKVRPFAGASKVSRPLPMDPSLPVSVNTSMTFAAESVAFSKLDQFPIEESQSIAIPRIMTIKAPPHGLRMVQLDMGMLFL
jgi:hypothetical protein